ncbi:Uncharacterised protein [Mycoplasmoides gallisepticum]|uniref:Uncharacterized protein n=1 Tax=Mycoplasmoides gallisepticum TaxID=2096 RepID=A0A3B0PP78_MYCGL|nr:Uncharacterised protein [Mycoplasmoides gallisepticum]
MISPIAKPIFLLAPTKPNTKATTTKNIPNEYCVIKNRLRSYLVLPKGAITNRPATRPNTNAILDVFPTQNNFPPTLYGDVPITELEYVPVKIQTTATNHAPYIRHIFITFLFLSVDMIVTSGSILVCFSFGRTVSLPKMKYKMNVAKIISMKAAQTTYQLLTASILIVILYVNRPNEKAAPMLNPNELITLSVVFVFIVENFAITGCV